MIEPAYTLGEALGLSVWTHDQAGPYQTIPQPGESWPPAGDPVRFPSECSRTGTAKRLTLLHPADGALRVAGVSGCPNPVLHPWLKEPLTQILAHLPPPAPPLDAAVTRQMGRHWPQGLSGHFTLPDARPPLRLRLVWDHLAGHKTPALVLWLVANGIMPLYTPLGGSWLNMAESIQRILYRRALAGQQPQSPEAIIAALEAVARHWNADPTPFGWGGKRAARRSRSRQRRHALGGSGAIPAVPCHGNLPNCRNGYRQTN